MVYFKAFANMTKEQLEYINLHLSYLFEKNRLDSFKSWPFDDSAKCNSKNMAAAGFIYTGTEEELDSVQCFLCHKSLDGWEPNDDPWLEHLSHSSKCLYVKLGKPESELKCSDILNIMEALLKRLADDIYSEGIEKLQTEAKYIKNALKAVKIKGLRGRK